MPEESFEIPTEVVLDVTDMRFKKVVDTRSEYLVERVSQGRYIIRKGSSVYYVGLERTDTISASCNCPDWRFHSQRKKVPCKHIWLVAEAEGLVTFPPVDMLPPEDKDGDGTEAGTGDKDEDDGQGRDRDRDGTGAEDIDIPID